MSIKEEFSRIIRQLAIDESNNFHEDDNYFETSPLIKAEIELFSRSLEDTINYLDNECTEYEFEWLSEVFEEVSINLNSMEFIDALMRTAQRFPDGEQKFYPLIDLASCNLSDDVYNDYFDKEE
jgi:hypothetical protein